MLWSQKLRQATHRRTDAWTHEGILRAQVIKEVLPTNNGQRIQERCVTDLRSKGKQCVVCCVICVSITQHNNTQQHTTQQIPQLITHNMLHNTQYNMEGVGGIWRQIFFRPIFKDFFSLLSLPPSSHRNLFQDIATLLDVLWEHESVSHNTR